MAKRSRKGEKLDLILSELSEMKADIAKLLKRQSEGGSVAKARRRPARPRPTKKASAKVRAGARTGAKPVLVELPPAEQPHTSSRRG